MSDEKNYNFLTTDNGVPIKAWTKGVPLEDQARQQLLNVAQLPFIFKWVAAMPDVHWGMGATVGSVIPTKGAIIPAAVGVDIGCGMMAVETDLNARDLPDNLKALRSAIEQAVPHGRTNHGGRGDVGAWRRNSCAQQRSLADAQAALRCDSRISEGAENVIA
jgi:tRNA-splicing ligase RtcB (3'-phosphate/5'-hydroxy nucleic acid ligase)